MSLQMRMLRPWTRSHFSQFVSPGDLVFDIGANVGDLTQVLLGLDVRVVCVDPQPYCVAVLSKKFADYPDVTIVAKGLNRQNGKLPFHISSSDHPTSTFSKRWQIEGRYNNRKWDQTIEVEVTTLDELIREFGTPVFCKIDVEGFEPKVLQGLSAPIPFLSFEFHQELMDNARLCAEHLSSLGNVSFNYSLYHIYSLRSDRWLTKDELLKKLASKRNGLLVGDIYARFA